ncbi:alpha,alpha-trehalase TreA [Celerinatantimonas yamalensis]|uniref:Alpha,alpha-trehalase TreA n=1 Tax=Celerinatantimonas yamalensis TaxID=559956 RepID=A0ABW9G3Z4_9GAMM
MTDIAAMLPRKPFRLTPIILSIALGLLPITVYADSSASRSPQPPDILLGSLFDTVQKAALFTDQKTFADAVPTSDPASIIASWQSQKTQPDFDLKQFVQHHFILPSQGQAYVPPSNQSLRAHIDGLWPVLTRTAKMSGKYDSLLPLPYSYVVPGGRFREVYYWDSYFTMLGLAESGHWDSIKNMVDNFAWELDHYGLIPNGNRSYYLSRSQPPFFSMMVDLLATHEGDKAYRHYLPQLQLEYDYWMQGRDRVKRGHAVNRVVKLDDGTLLNRYWDARDVPRTESWLDDIKTARHVPQDDRAKLYRNLRAGAASGWDFSSRWFAKTNQLTSIRTTQLVPVDLNSLIYHLERVLAKAYKLNDQSDLAKLYTQRANVRRAAINHYLWNDQQGWYADYNWKEKKIHPQLTAATLFPLYMQIAEKNQAKQTAKAVDQQLIKPGGLLTTTLNTGQQWDAPNGWAPLQWIAVKGLDYYHQPQLSKKVGLRFLRNVQVTYDKEHKLVEKYVVEGKKLGGGGGGEYPLQDGFGWTNGVTLMLLDKYCPAQKTCNSAHDIPNAQ